MAERATPTPPKGLNVAGRGLWVKLHEALPETVEFDERERALLELACRQADDVARLERAVRRDGATVVGSRGQTRLHPALGELRQARLAVGRLLGELELPNFEEKPQSARSRHAQKAANVRWAQVAARRERARGA